MRDNWLRKRAILDSLSRGEFVSGEILAAELGISRAAVHKHIDALAQYGVEVYSVKGRGYKLASPISLVDESKLLSNSDHRCFYFDEIDSTNTFLLKHVQELSSGDICVAEYQSAGRGRRGRQWQSPYGSHLYYSFYWDFLQGMAQVMGLSLVVACSLEKVFREMGVKDIGLKWPNDIYHNYKKLAGVLIEMNGQADSECHLVIGVGINLAMPDSCAKTIDQPWSDLTDSGVAIDKTELLLALQKQMVKDIQLFELEGLSGFQTRWADADLFYAKSIQLQMGDNFITGICRGIDGTGAILLESDEGTKAYVGGEISMRAKPS